MKISEIQVYGYGKLENMVISNLDSLCVFYGENEAGKSTIMSFIHSILFGFPTKTQSEQRYEPKTGVRYGGKLILLSERGRVVIERIKGKSSGDVSVILEDGTQGGEELLTEVLGKMDKSLYQSIFSFNLQGLQNIQQLKKEELGRFLFSTGAIGTERIVAIESMLQKELENRFRPSGKKPVINAKVEKVKELYRELKNAERNNNEYWHLIQQVNELESDLSLLARREEKIIQEQQKLREWIKLEPIIKERMYLEEKLKENIPSMFPIDGVNRLEKLIQWMKPLEAQKKRLDIIITEMEEEILHTKPNQDILEKEEEIQFILDRFPLLEALKEEEKSLRITLDHLHRQKRDCLEKLHLPLDDKTILSIDTSMFMKDRVSKAQKHLWKLTEKKEDLESFFEKEKSKLEELENQIIACKRDMLSDEEFTELDRKINANHPALLESEYSQVKQTINMLEMMAGKGRANHLVHILTLFAVGLFLGGFGWINSDWFLMVVGVTIFFVVLVFTISSKLKRNEKTLQTKLEELHNKEKDLYYQLQSAKAGDFYEQQVHWEKEKRKREVLQHLQVKWEQHNQQYEQIISEFEIWETDFAHHDKELSAIAKELQLPKELVKTYLLEAFELLINLKSTIHEINSQQSQVDSKVEAIQKITSRIEELGSTLLGEQTSISQYEMALKNGLREEKNKEIVYREKRKKFEESVEELDKVQIELKHFENEMNELYHLAGVRSEEDYRLAGALWEKRLELENKIEEINKHITFTSLTGQEIRELLAKNHSEESGIREAELNKVRVEREDSLKLLSEIRHKIAMLEEGGKYSELLHKYTQLKAELDYEAKNWARFAIAKELLHKTVKIFNEEKLPIVLKKAEEYLSFLTDGNYQRIVPKENGSGFFIHRSDYTVFEANELSQATMEQVYVSIRFALVTTIYKNKPFPIIIDDSFVNFDHVRTGKVIELLKCISNHQILFFTCHQHLLDKFSNIHIIKLEENPVPQ